jgi:large subunit ribosomal protein L25
MSEKYVMQAWLREETGKNAMRRLRKKGLLPGIIFGRSGETTPVNFNPKDLEKIIHSETGFNTIFTMDVEGLTKDNLRQVLIKEYQVDPVTHNFIHVSFYRVRMDRKVEISVPIIADGIPIGVKDQGGTLDHTMREIEIRCLPGDIPDAIHINVGQMKIGDHVRVSELSIPGGVQVMEDPDNVVLHVVPPRKVVEAVPAEEVAEGEEAAAPEEGGEPAEEE